MSKEIHQNVAWTFIHVPVNWYLWITKTKKCLQKLKCVEKKKLCYFTFAKLGFKNPKHPAISLSIRNAK